MKTTFMLVAGLLSVIGTSAFAQDNGFAQVKADNAAIRHDTREVRVERRTVQHDNRAIAMEKRDLGDARNVASLDRHEARRDQRREDALVARGDLRDARRVDKARRQELNNAKFAAHVVRHDRKEIAVARQDRASEKAVLTEQRGERRADVAKRNHDAANVY